MRNFFRQPFLDVLAALEQLAKADSARSRGVRILVVPFVVLIATWFVYVPIHELLHVLGCVATGGTVTRLELSARYGANLLSKVFPFIVSGSDYAGQLKGFDTKGSDLCYLATDFLPFVLSIVIGVPLVKLAGRRPRPVLFGMAVVLGLAPFYNLSGDYFEMASIITTRTATTVSGGDGSLVYEKLRSDDIFRLVSDLKHHPDVFGVETLGSKAVAIGLIAISAVVALFLTFGTYWLGHLLCVLALRPNGPRRSAIDTPK